MRRLALLFIAAFCIAANVGGQTTPLTTTDLSDMLTSQCEDLGKLTLEDKDLADVTCTEVDGCKTALSAAISKAFSDQVKGSLKTKSTALLKKVEGDSRTVQRLHPVLAARETSLKAAIPDAVKNAVNGLTIATTGTGSLADRAKADAKTAVPAAVGSILSQACIANDASVLDAVFPKTPTLGEAAAINRKLAEGIVNEAERQAFAEFTKAEGFARSVDCLWTTVTDNGQSQPKLACKPGLLVSGEQVSEIRIHGVPKGEVQVTAVSSEQFTQGSDCGKDDLTCDNLRFGEPLHRPVPNPIIIAVHTARAFFPTWGTRRGSSLEAAKEVLRPEKQSRNKLSLITNGTAPTISVSIRTDDNQEVSTAIPVGFARWKIESGGFLAVSKLIDNEVVTGPVADGKVPVTSIRRADNFAQDSGIFATFIPQNYQSIGVTLGIATPSGRRTSFYLGPGLRVRTFGDKGLASLSFGVAMRSVLRFPDVKVGQSYTPDSAVLKGKEQFGIHMFIAINLGFRIGSFGPGETEK